jgi:hypothetical protein
VLAMGAVQWADRIGLRALFPVTARQRLHALKKWLFRRPVRFIFRPPQDATEPVRLGRGR